MVNMGNDVRTCVRNYLRHSLAMRRETDAARAMEPHVANRLGAPGVDDALVQQWLSAQAQSAPLSVYITGYGKQVSVHNIAYLRVPKPHKLLVKGTGMTEGPVAGSSAAADEEYLLAIGLSLKKKDAERACYMHAAALLYHHGEDVLAKHRAGLPRHTTPITFEELARSITPPLPPPFSNVDQRPGADGTDPPKPFMHVLMRSFLASGRAFTPPKRRSSASPYSPY